MVNLQNLYFWSENRIFFFSFLIHFFLIKYQARCEGRKRPRFTGSLIHSILIEKLHEGGTWN